MDFHFLTIFYYTTTMMVVYAIDIFYPYFIHYLTKLAWDVILDIFI